MTKEAALEYMRSAYLNAEILKTHILCGCYMCCTSLKTREIKEYTDEGRTALCPVCGLDTIVPGPLPIGKLAEIKLHALIPSEF